MKRIGEHRKLLGVDKTATLKDLKTIYRNTMKDAHPDKFVNDEAGKLDAEEKSKSVIEAYHFLVSINQLNEKKKILSEEIKYYIERNQNKEFIVKKLSEKHQVNPQIIEELFSGMKRKGSLFIFCGILFLIPAILRMIIIGNQNHNPNLMWDLLYFLVVASASLIFFYLGFQLKKKYR